MSDLGYEATPGREPQLPGPFWRQHAAQGLSGHRPLPSPSSRTGHLFLTVSAALLGGSRQHRPAQGHRPRQHLLVGRGGAQGHLFHHLHRLRGGGARPQPDPH
ncbi:MAG: hypothetical protein MZU79_01280 [Anaerotruncus sp.]|nr:hypothetical protein [Anaerotruncus sp.]